MGAFSTKTVYRAISFLEGVLAIVIISFSVKCLVIYDDKNPTKIVDHKDKDGDDDNDDDLGHREYIQYSAIVACGQSVIQLIAAVLLATKSKFSTIANEDIPPGPIPKVWIWHTAIQFVVQIVVFFAPILFYNPAKEPDDMKFTLKELFTYTLVSAIFKIFFIWGVVSKLNPPKHSSSQLFDDDEKSLDKD